MPAVEHPFPERRGENVKLNCKGVNKESVRECRPCVLADECHQKTETDQHHDIHVLVKWVVCGCERGVIVNLVSNKH
jgi:hypothetical protein